MSQRTLRVNELLLREISGILHTDYQSECVAVTVSGVEVAPDLRNARVFYSVVGAHPEQEAARDFFRRRGETIRRKVGRAVVLKYLPHFTYIYDESMERGSQTLSILDELGMLHPGPEGEDETHD